MWMRSKLVGSLVDAIVTNSSSNYGSNSIITPKIAKITMFAAISYFDKKKKHISHGINDQ